MIYLYWAGYIIFLFIGVGLEFSYAADKRAKGENYDPTSAILLAALGGIIFWPILLPIMIYKQLYPERDRD